eukprot:m.230237 g.230237  ORF g.230237 m.230237 type:complete len:4579 (-) comp33576_c0_seq1:2736-16472(-)
MSEKETPPLSAGELRTYLREVIPLILGGTEGQLDVVLKTKENDDMLTNFIKDDTPMTSLVVVRNVPDAKDGDDDSSDATGKPDESSEDAKSVDFELMTTIKYTDSKQAFTVLIKRSNQALTGPGRMLPQQLRMATFTEGTPFETLQAFVAKAVRPYLISAVSQHRSGESRSAEKVVDNLELQLQQLQQNIDIPEVTLTIHPRIKAVCDNAAKENRKPTVEEFDEKEINEASFLNALQKGVARWIKEIHKVTKIERDPSSGTAMQEVTFWLNLDRALQSIQEKRNGDGVKLTMDLLKLGNRHLATTGMQSDTGLPEALAKVENYSVLMKDFAPILRNLLTATESYNIAAALVDIFTHMKKIKNTMYKVPRALKLVHAISRDLDQQLRKFLSNRYLMHQKYEEFDKIIEGCERVFLTWEEEDEKFRNTLREMIKRRRDDMKTFRRVTPQHKALQERLASVAKFRKQHEQLRTVIGRVLRPSRQEDGQGLLAADDAGAIEEVDQAYADVKTTDVLDLTPAGFSEWQEAQKKYDVRIDAVEKRITAKLRDQLGAAKNANEMFRIFGKFNALFVRPQIRGAIRDFQAQLIDRVKQDIGALHTKFKEQYHGNMVAKMSEVRDLPEVSGQIIWARQINRQLTEYLKRVEDVLGKEWKNHRDGMSLKAEGDSFRHKLDTQMLFDNWAAEVTKRQLGASGRFFDIELKRNTGVPGLVLAVNFHPQIITISKEVRNLKWLGFRVPLVIVNKALQASHLYPYAVSLKASVRTYKQTLDKIIPSVQSLVATYHKAIQTWIGEGVILRWESYRLESYVQELAEKVFTFQDKVDDILAFDKQLNKLIDELEKCSLDTATLNGILEQIQKIVDDLNLRSYSNLDSWVKKLDLRVEEKLKVRLTKALTVWSVALHEYGDKDAAWDARDSGLSKEAIDVADLPTIKSSVHEISIRDNVMFLSPPIERARSKLFNQLQTFIAIVTDLPRIQASKYVMGRDVDALQKSKATYRNVLSGPANGGADLLKAYRLIEDKMASVSGYVQIWFQYQALWDLQTDTITNRLGDDLDQWQQLIVEIKKARRTFDTSESTKDFGPICINFAQVQNRVMLRYDQLHKDMLNKFGTKLSSSMEEFYNAINRARSDLEVTSVESASTQDSVSLITMIQDLKRKQSAWAENIEMFRLSEKVLERQRFQFPNGWRYVDSLTGEWDAFCEIMARKDGQLSGQMNSLLMKVANESRMLDQRVDDLLADWARSKPVGGQIDPDQAMSTLAIFESRFVQLKDEYDQLSKAKSALDMDTRATAPLDPSLDELRDLKSSWSELSRIFTSIKELKAVAWSAVVPRQIKKKLDDLINEMRNLPARVRSYASYEATLETITSYKTCNKYIEGLKSEAIKERHWRDLIKGLPGIRSIVDLTLGKIYDADLEKHKKVVEGVLVVAQGEMALEKFLQQTRDEWNSYELDLVNFQNKTKLIRGWIDLFDKCRERMAALAAMKISPYYRVFQEEATSWDDKLNRVAAVFEVWMEVQQGWVYLEGIFGSGADIRHLLPSESSRFESISTEFKGLMKKVSANPSVMDVINIPNVFKALERLAELLTQIKKSLTDYLEKERSLFPRFYFVGDEDLLEIIGNSKDTVKLQKHFRKLFKGVHSIILDELDPPENVLGVTAKEGENVHFVNSVPIKGVKINIWLTNLVKEINVTLATLLASAVGDLNGILQNFDEAKYMEYIDNYQAQLVVLACQVSWSEAVDGALQTGGGAALQAVLDGVLKTIKVLADTVLLFQPPIRRLKLEHLITEMVHQRDVTRSLMKDKVNSAQDFQWLSQMRFYFDAKNTNVLEQLSVRVADANFFYGFEYLGLTDKLVQTPLTDRAYMTLTQGLKARQGGAPFGPAGTGKTESVKMLGGQLGRFVLVFNCDETFDSEAMQRILVGLCQVGAWGCFDEFNRLEEAQLSAVSQQIQTIQLALKRFATEKNVTVEVVQDREVPLSSDVGIFVTMNPGYAGRSNLPDNLKKLFRQLAMTAPDRQLIAQVMLFSQGFRDAEALSKKIVPLFILCKEQLSSQSHYDWMLRALKQVLVSAGNIKRTRLADAREACLAKGQEINEEEIAASIDEQTVLIQSVRETMVPKLVSEDIPLLNSLLSDVFPGVRFTQSDLGGLADRIRDVMAERHLSVTDEFLSKVLQLYGVICLSHGLMLVGPSGAGKSVAWTVLLEALRRHEGKQGHKSYVIDPKALSKDDLYGALDPTTREWTDGVFTYVLRKIIDNKLNELDRRQWIIFDGDVDPEWVENLNSVLDDNKLLTLPNGERLAIPPNVRIMFEVEDLHNATAATVSRCGMVWFSEDIVTTHMMCEQFLSSLESDPLESNDGASDASLKIQRAVADNLRSSFADNGLVYNALRVSAGLDHIMVYTHGRMLNSLFAMIKSICRKIFAYNSDHPDFPMEQEQLEKFSSKQFLYSLMWCFSGDGNNKVRKEFSDHLARATNIALPPLGEDAMIIDYEVTIEGEWAAWHVPEKDIDIESSSGTDVVIPTLDTVRHRDLLYTWLSDHLPVVLCGPPGSGKTMTLFNALRALPDFVVVGLNFSNATGPDLLMNTFMQHCEYRRTPNGVVLAPMQVNKWLVIFCDEQNLPAPDKYSTVKVITFMRQLIEHGGFWRPDKQDFVKLERIQFVGACNPPTDPGRVPLSLRYLRHVPVVYVDYPSAASYTQIYRAFNRAIMKRQPDLKPYADPLTDAMVDFFLQTQETFTADIQPFYIYSPREMTRWVKGLKEALWPLDTLSLEGLIRIWAHEALRLFQDRLVSESEREWTEMKIDEIAKKHFPTLNMNEALHRPILYSSWLDKNYVPVELEVLRKHVEARMKVFHEEELDVPLVLFNEVLDHVLRIDRVFKQNQGHVLMIGISGSGKTTLSRFVAWMNGLSVFQVKVHNQYTAEDFDEDLRVVLRRAGTKGEKIVFIMDEGNVMDTAFLERINTLLANGEVPGLFDGDEFAALMTQCKDGSQRSGVVLTGNDELYKWFSEQVMKNLHVVFTMNPAEGGMQDRAATSPALFNRCVLDWFGDWSKEALYQVSSVFTAKMDTDKEDYTAPMAFPAAVSMVEELELVTHRDAVNNAFVFVHQSVKQLVARQKKQTGVSTYVTPRHFLEAVNQFKNVYHDKRENLEEHERHLRIGLQKIQDTFTQVEEMRKGLAVKRQTLEAANISANETLQVMVKDQQEAEAKKSESEKLEVVLAEKLEQAATRKVKVETELAEVIPAIESAQQAVDSIQKKDLKELQNLCSRNPPATVKNVVEGVLTLLGDGKVVSDWKACRQIIAKADFIERVQNFNPESATPKIQEKLTFYTSQENFTVERAMHASRAAGPLLQWTLAQIAYTNILLQIEPLRLELASLEKEANEMQIQQDTVTALIKELITNIDVTKRNYAKLIAKAQAIQSDLETVETKVERSVRLLGNLEGEKTRWSESAAGFETQMGTLVGDSFMASAFLAYSGYFDQHDRLLLNREWQSHITAAGIVWDKNLAITKYLSTPDVQLEWKKCKLPDDELCTENAIMLKMSLRYPLIIDPAGQAVEFVLNQYKDEKIIKSSFHNQGFRKDLESALRFGTPLLIQDAEKYDPIMNPVLNREVKKANGRTIINLGDQEIDMSTLATKIILTATDPKYYFSPDLCSRVTMVNFTVTPASLHSQCLNKVLRSERPDVEQKRSELLKLQGDYQAQLYKLEESLLSSLSQAQGSLLDDDVVITKLESIKQKAAEVQVQVEQADTTMQEINITSNQYDPLATRCSAIFFTLQQLSLVHFLYQYTLGFFLDIFQKVLSNNDNLNGTEGKYDERLEIITRDLFTAVYGRVAPGMLDDDRGALALTLARLQIKGTDDDFNQKEFDTFVRGASYGGEQGDFAKYVPSILNAASAAQAHVLATTLPAFKSLAKTIEQDVDGFKAWLQEAQPETLVPALVEKSESSSNQTLRELLLLQAFRGDRVQLKAISHVTATFGEQFIDAGQTDFRSIVDVIDPRTPLLLCGVKGFDASSSVLDYAESRNKRVKQIAIGGKAGFSAAERAVEEGKSTGRWVLLSNVHLAPKWLEKLAKALVTGAPPKPDFRLFLTSDITPKLPNVLLMAANTQVFEAAPGVKANMLRTLNALSEDRVNAAPAERGRLFFLLAWLHAVIQERIRYAPLGWSKQYEFGEPDLRAAIDTVDTWMTTEAGNRANLPPDKIPFNALQTLLSQTIYGGRVDNSIDDRLLSAFVKSVFCPEAFGEFELVAASGSNPPIMVPTGTQKADFIRWVSALPSTQQPTWIGLPNNAERVLMDVRSRKLAASALKLQTSDDIVSTLAGGEDEGPTWMKTLAAQAEQWLSLLPETLKAPKRSADSIKDPMFRFFEREITVFTKLLAQVRGDLDQVLEVCRGEIKQTNYLRGLIDTLNKGDIYPIWKKYNVPLMLTVNGWVIDFGLRLKQYSQVSDHMSNDKSTQSMSVWLGGLMVPEAYFTATRQCVAQKHGWSLEQLRMEIEGKPSKPDAMADTEFLLTDIRFEGAVAEGQTLKLLTKTFETVPFCVLRWSNDPHTAPANEIADLPIYLNCTRDTLLVTVDFHSKEIPRHVLYNRGAALMCSELR